MYTDIFLRVCEIICGVAYILYFYFLLPLFGE